MIAALLLARVLLAGVFGLAATSKLANRTGFSLTLSDFGVPWRLTAVGAVALPVTELITAGLLVVTSTARVGAIAAFALLTVFCIAMIRLLLRGERPDCGCVGRLEAAPIGPSTILRNAALGATAVPVALAGPGTSLVQVLTAFGGRPYAVAFASLGVLAAGQSWFSWQLFRQHGRLLARMRMLEARESAGLRIGEVAPLDPQLAETVDAPFALIFSSLGCGACLELEPALERFRDEGLELVVVEDDRELVRLFGVDAVPSGVLISADGRIDSEMATGRPAVEALLLSALSSRTELRFAAG